MARLFSPVRTHTAPSPVATNRSSPGTEQALAHQRGAERPHPGVWPFENLALFPPARARATKASLEIAAADSPLEHEADRIADQAVSRPEPLSQRAVRVYAPHSASGLQVPPIVHEVLRSPGKAFDRAVHGFPAYGPMQHSRPNGGIGPVRVHTDAKAAASARAVDARAYAFGNHIVFGEGEFAPHSPAGRRLIAHELVHIAQQRRVGPMLMRAPTPNTTQPRTFIIVYGSGQLNPMTNDHNVGQMFEKVARQKLNEIKKRLGNAASKHTFVFEYTPSEIELKKVLNAKHAAPVAELHLFSHGYSLGANLGGPVPEDVRHRPKTETPEDAEQRHLEAGDLSLYSIDFAEDATVVFYGCNIGNVPGAGGRPFAQAFSDAFGVPVTASTTSTHFDNKNKAGWHQVPDAGGKMIDFTPDQPTARRQIANYIKKLAELAAKKTELDNPKGGLIGVMIREDRARTTIDKLTGEIDKLHPLVHRLIQFLPDTERAATLKDMLDGEKLAGISGS
jgi:Domain of unknown function (DUF4157)